jgi:hypothetical protein
LYINPSAIDTLYSTLERKGLILLVRTTYGANLINLAIFGGAFAALGMEGVRSYAFEYEKLQKLNISTGPIYMWLALVAFFAINLLL